MNISTDITILLVEDASVMRKMERKVLGSLGFKNIVEAENGDEAISKLESEEKIDIVISDWNMPEKDGFELLVWVRADDRFKDVPFLMATGRGEKKEVEKVKEAGVSSFISKPFNAEELQSKMEEAFGVKEDEVEEESTPKVTEEGKVRLRIAHIQITDHLALGVLKHLINTGEYKPEHFELETVCMGGWNPVAEALEKGTVDGACILAPLAMDLYSYGTDLKLILFAHKNGSIFVRNKDGDSYHEPYQDFFRQKSFYIPHMMSIHNMLAHMFFDGVGLNPGVSGHDDVNVNFEVIAPVKMPEFLASNPDSSGYLVAEPLGTKAIAAGIAELQFLSSELWENHPCCVVTMQNEALNLYEKAIQEFSDMFVKAGKYIARKPGAAAEIAVRFLDPDKKLGLKVPILKNVLSDPKGITYDELYPVKEDLDKIQHYMHDNMGIGSLIDLNEFVDLRFADKACIDTAGKRKESQLYNTSEDITKMLLRGAIMDKDQIEKQRLDMEGKYLMFSLGGQFFGIDILKIIEIIRKMKVRKVPSAPSFVMGVINFRGKVIPVIDPRVLFGLDTSSEFSESSYIIILEIETLNQPFLMGLSVDTVSEISDIKAEAIEEAPEVFKGINTKYILAMARMEEKIRILVDVNRFMDRDKNVEVSKMFKKEEE